VTAAMINRTRWFKRPWLLVSAVVLLVGLFAFAFSDTVRFVVCSVFDQAVYGAPNEADWQQVVAIRNKITTVHHFARNSVSQPDRPPVFGNPGSKMLLTRPTVIDVYEVRNSSEQDKIIAAVRTELAGRKSKPVDLRFYDHENFPAESENYRERGPETLLRRVRLNPN
jgi:hypothetical protein